MRKGNEPLTICNGVVCPRGPMLEAGSLCKEAREMDAIEILRQMHVEAKSAFDKLEHAGPDERGERWDKLHPELKLHEQLEERFVYDPVSHEVEGRDPVLADWHRRHHEEVG